MPNSIDRNSYDGLWLNPSTPHSRYSKFSHKPVQERAGIRDNIHPHLRQAIIDHHFNPTQVANLLTKLGHIKTAQELASRLPLTHTSRMGNFGEVVLTEHLVQRYGYQIPVFKLRYRDSALPMRGEDVVAFVRDATGKITKLCVGEAKARRRATSRTIEDAHNRLQKTYRPRPETLVMIASILYEKGQDTFAREIEQVLSRLASRRIDRDNWVMIIHQQDSADPFGYIQGLPKVVPGLTCVDLKLSDLEQFVRKLFE